MDRGPGELASIYETSTTRTCHYHYTHWNHLCSTLGLLCIYNATDEDERQKHWVALESIPIDLFAVVVAVS